MVSISVSVSISMTISKTVSNGVCTMSKSITISSIGTIESISLWLSISITLSISIMGIAKTVSVAIAKRRVSKMTISMTKRVNTMSKTISSIRMVENISISLSLTLGSMDNTMDTYSVGNIRNTISMVDRDSMDSMVYRG